MDAILPARRGILATLLALAFFARPSRGDEIAASAALPGIAIHGPAETLRDYCRWEDDRLWLELPGGARFELVTSTSDPAIANPGDGSFHPFDEAVVRAALAEVRFPLHRLDAQVFLLPGPRRAGLRSAAGPGLVLLSPGVMPLPREQQHAEVVHEVGHLVQYALLPDQDVEGWERYRRLRGITDLERFRADAPHADRPHEIFAEDFRSLFGGASANYSGSIENASLAAPQAVEGLAAFLGGLVATTAAHGALRAYPNPSRGPISFRREGGEAATLDLFDLAGRRLASLEPSRVAGGWSWTWNGSAHGIVLARPRGGREPALRVALTR